ncbi:T9SS type B sorting domain-containing protein [Algibacter sp. L4_22]|uniref:T9SS type B sorting domain-containing protein n=1 Tax=Algibacter sp. L4_22 TaxID=2942477 RepID=UPI00201B7282|nr:T9SS type B sorting domain-containing protein [Algibacter sp. L4_22]MCL5128152.1 T9SS type B sorting domain-containing protein [Algibacter sp. L4_22]
MILFFLIVKAYSSVFIYNTPYNFDGDAVVSQEGSFNMFSLDVLPPSCTTLSSPISGDTGVPVNTTLSWNSVSNVTGYKLTIGTVSGGTDILNAFDVGNVLIYNLPISLPESTTIYVSIIPYNLDGDALGCQEDFFNTFAPNVLAPICTILRTPLAGDIRVPLETDLSWESISNATGYKLTIGTTSGGTDILNAFDVGNVLSYNLPLNLPEFTAIYVSITPYNIAGEAFACDEEFFTTKSLVPVPSCTSLLVPLDNAKNVPVDTNIEWPSVPGATGYMLTLETLTTGIDVLNIFDLGDVTSYTPPTNLPKNRTIVITIVPYNIGGEAIGCIEEFFQTGEVIGAEIPPKFFTPNNDNTNDYWIVPNLLNQVSKVLIYNRYGKLLKQINDLSIGWDGTLNGNPLQKDDYWYQIIYKDGKVLKGHFSLVR